MRKKWKYLFLGLAIGVFWTMLFIGCGAISAPSHEPLLFGRGCMIFAIPTQLAMRIFFPILEHNPRLFVLNYFVGPPILFAFVGFVLGAIKDAKEKSNEENKPNKSL